jgi:hypothetical protein
MSEINIIDEFYIPLINSENVYNSKEYKLLKENNVDTAELEGREVHPQSGEVKLGEVTDDEKRTLAMDVMDYIKAMPKDLVISVLRGGMNGFDFVNDVAAFATYGNRKVPEESVFKFIDERIEAQKKSLNELDKDDPLTTRIIAAIGQDAAYVYPIYKKIKSVGIPKQYALPFSFALGSTLAFDKKTSFMVDTDGINGLKTAVGIDDDTPADELFDKTVQALEFGVMGIAFDKIFPIIKNIKKFRRADQAAVTIGGAAASGEAAKKVQDNLGNNNISQTTEKE